MSNSVYKCASVCFRCVAVTTEQTQLLSDRHTATGEYLAGVFPITDQPNPTDVDPCWSFRGLTSQQNGKVKYMVTRTNQKYQIIQIIQQSRTTPSIIY